MLLAMMQSNNIFPCGNCSNLIMGKWNVIVPLKKKHICKVFYYVLLIMQISLTAFMCIVSYIPDSA